MRRAHWWVGTLSLVTFLFTGSYMLFIHEPPVETLDDATRMLYRSRHIYIMLAALANLGLVRVEAETLLDRVISTLVLIAPVFLIAAFFLEPARGIDGVLWIQFGLYPLFAAAALLAVRNAHERS